MLAVGYLSQVPRRPGGWRAELTDPVSAPFMSLIPIVGMLLATALMRHALTAGRWLLAIFMAATTASPWNPGLMDAAPAPVIRSTYRNFVCRC